MNNIGSYRLPGFIGTAPPPARDKSIRSIVHFTKLSHISQISLHIIVALIISIVYYFKCVILIDECDDKPPLIMGLT
jgi:hypothetical protein